MVTSTEGLVPITRVFLAKFYDKYPFEALVPELGSLRERMTSLCDKMEVERLKQPEADPDLRASLEIECPHKIDENMWKNREQIEECLFLLNKPNWPASVQAEDTPKSQAFAEACTRWKEGLSTLLAEIETYQTNTSESVFQMVLTYMPQDFRGTLIKQQRSRSELKRKAEIDLLLNNGGSIAQKYQLLWQQQMDRRKTLASLGSAEGVFRYLVKYLVGVPQVLLDFVKTINDHNGPMEEQRNRYGPSLYELTRFVNLLRIFLTLWFAVYDTEIAESQELSDVAEQAIKVYSAEFTRFLDLIKLIFENSPFLIKAEDAMTAEERSQAAEFKEVTVANGYKHEVPLTVEVEGSVIAWDFNLTLGKDVGFSVDYTNSAGAKTGIVPYQRYEANQGSFNAPGVGAYSLVWDNSYSYLNRKTVRFKVDVIPPVGLAEDEKFEEALAEETADPQPAA
eukprot:TRINITY_DN23305_c0_g1_i1.p1 TRINITY_DN23305_c0_g1~~TRINITY_DN23305_c0_g1_i1.p1  ORF type:complete len:452 (-),score=97.88 TRINITY_DN23305_c0_g1_i1:813-2168(-)